MRKRIVVVAWVTLSIVTMIVCIYCFRTVLPETWAHGERWKYAQRLMFLIVPLCAMALLRRAPSDYGLSLKQMPRELGIGLAIGAGLLGATFLFGALFHGFPWALNSMNLSWPLVAAQVVRAGFCEEFLYRGYCQGELNRVFDRPFSMGQTRYGWPVFVTAALFALSHMLGQFNPLEGHWRLDLVPLSYTLYAGVVFGIAREHFNGILSVAFIHGGTNLAFGLFDSLATRVFAETVFLLVFVCIYIRATREVSSIKPSAG